MSRLSLTHWCHLILILGKSLFDSNIGWTFSNLFKTCVAMNNVGVITKTPGRIQRLSLLRGSPILRLLGFQPLISYVHSCEQLTMLTYANPLIIAGPYLISCSTLILRRGDNNWWFNRVSIVRTGKLTTTSSMVLEFSSHWLEFLNIDMDRLWLHQDLGLRNVELYAIITPTGSIWRTGVLLLWLRGPKLFSFHCRFI